MAFPIYQKVEENYLMPDWIVLRLFLKSLGVVFDLSRLSLESLSKREDKHLPPYLISTRTSAAGLYGMKGQKSAIIELTH